jgi:hypothetical protein
VTGAPPGPAVPPGGARRRRAYLFTAAAVILGAAAAGAYAHFVGCKTGTCPLTSNVWTASLYGAFVGLVVGWPGRARRSAHEPQGAHAPPERAPAEPQG